MLKQTALSFTSLAKHIAAHSGMLAFAAGGLTTLAFAPFALSPLAVFSLALLFWLWRDAAPGQALRLGWLYGLGLMGFGVNWLHISINQFGNVGLALALLFTALFVAAMALYFALAGWLAVRLASGGDGVRLLLIFPAVWVLLEWVRGWFLTGFPWLVLGYSQIDTSLQGFAPVLGVYGVSAAAALSAGLVALLSLRVARGETGGRVRAGLRAWPVLAGLAAIWLGGAALITQQWSTPAGRPLKVSLIQGNIEQELKWSAEQMGPTLALYVRLTRNHWDSDLVIWPETAVPAFYHQVDKALLTPLEQEAQANSTDLLLGIAVHNGADGRYFNAMASLGAVRDAYYKRHLVPFGEFMPLRGVIGPLLDFLQIPMSDFSTGEKDKTLLRLAGYPAGISICYEDAFGEEVIEGLPAAAFLVNASNDAWFGDSLAPHQHLEMARMRALETGRYLLRATNTGVSAVIGPRGELRGRSPAFQEHVLSADIVPLQGATPYVRWGNAGVVLLLAMVLGLGLLLGRHRPADVQRSPS